MGGGFSLGGYLGGLVVFERMKERKKGREDWDMMIGDEVRDISYVYRSSHCRGLNSALAGCIPAVFVPRREDELGVRVCSYELRDECGGWQVADCLAVAEKLIPLLSFEGLALAFVFGEEGLTPEVHVRRVFEEAVPVICIFETELLEGNAYGCPRD